jgi:cysteinyl-tRNA synthetase
VPKLDPIAIPEALLAARERRPGLLKLIGDTPLVALDVINPNPKVTLLAKLERNNPGGSVKDRVAVSMIEAAERSGELTRGKTIIEATSGNTGIGLAMVAALKGYRITLVMHEAVSIERRQILAALGAEVMLTPAALGTDGAIEFAYGTAAADPERYYLPDQYNNPNNPLAHYYGTGVEIWQQTHGRVTHFVAGLGTSGTLMGTGRRLRELKGDIQIVAVEPHLGHRLQGMKNLTEAYVPGIFDWAVLNRKINVDDDTAFEMTRRLAREEGLFVGMSAGAAVCGALEVIKDLDAGVVVTLLPDGGDRYLSTPLFQVAEQITPEAKLSFVNTLSRKIEPFVPLESGRVRMYACGPTAHARPHLGLMRRIIFTDLVRRTCEFAGYDVELVMNITDIDDKVLAAAEATGLPVAEVTAQSIRAFEEDVAALRIKPATSYPKASEHIDDMLATTRELVERGLAYEKHHSVYFDVSRFGGYGKLSGIDLTKLKVGATVELDRYDKDNPRDFTLLKRSSLAEIRSGAAYRTEWGQVRPGWHVECAAIALKTLGGRYDVHLGGHDLVFPHHENEIAVCESLTGQQPATFWLHSAVVNGADGKKMSHSLDNAVSVRDLLDAGVPGREIRLYLLGKNYRQPFRYSREDLDAASASLRRLDALVRRLRAQTDAVGDQEETAAAIVELKHKFTEALFEDLNMPLALAELFNFVRRANRLLDVGKIGDRCAQRIIEVLERLDTVLGLGLPEVLDANDEVDALVAQREQARQAGDFDQADALRAQLERLGVQVDDAPEGPVVRRR